MILLVFSKIVSAFLEINSSYQTYQYYLENSHYLSKCFVYSQPENEKVPIAQEEIQKGDLLLKVPYTEILTSFDTFEYSEHFKDQSEELKFIAQIVYFKLHQKPEKVAKILNSLNPHPGSAHTWDTPSKEVLKDYVHNQSMLIKEDPNYEVYSNIAKEIEGVNPLFYDKNAYYWGKFVLDAASIPIKKEKWKEIRGFSSNEEDHWVFGFALVPFLELFNRVVVPDTSRHEPLPIKFTDTHFELYSNRNYGIYDEIYIPLTNKDNYELLFTRGMTVKFNKEDRILVKEEIESGEERVLEFYIGNEKVDENYLAYCSEFDEPLLSYRRGVRRIMENYVHDLRSLRRREKVLIDHEFREAFKLSTAEKWNAYQALANIDRRIIQDLLKF